VNSDWVPVKGEDSLNQLDIARRRREVERRLDEAAQADAEEGIRQGLEDANNGRFRPIGEFFAEFEAAHSELKRG
jgi:hypothetical protein